MNFDRPGTVPRKTIGQSSYSVAGPHMWNDLPINVRSAHSLTVLKEKSEKVRLFRRHFMGKAHKNCTIQVLNCEKN